MISIDGTLTFNEPFVFAEFELNLQYPPFNLLASPFSDYTQEIGSPSHQYPFIIDQLVNSTNLVDPIATLISFASETGASLDPSVFTVSYDS